MRDFAVDHPYTTIASIGAASTLALLSSGYLASRVFRYLVPRSSSNGFGGFGNGKMGAGERVGGGGGGGGIRLEEMEKRILGQVEASNRDRRSELERFRRELMGTLEMAIQPGAKIMNSNTPALMPTTMGLIKASNSSNKKPMMNPSFKTLTTTTPTKFQDQGTDPASSKKDKSSTISAPVPKLNAASLRPDAPIAGNMDEARLAQVLRGAVEDVLDARGIGGMKDVVSASR